MYVEDVYMPLSSGRMFFVFFSYPTGAKLYSVFFSDT